MPEWLMNSGLMAVGASIGYGIARATQARPLGRVHHLHKAMELDSEGIMRALRGR
ncbi:hypothetical protein JHN48_34530 [Streptomyces sp. MBT72]|uniref:hypothetical protein n=1 Tax=Streptomyces sp. MBT72 TaxID=1488402 RepID=UPI001914E3DA|nr:hypothetical protein [Streptomyces sp. MBT72]MBK3534586.1 hypothetical protein [Streptomyces sp. MBT72]MBK3582394.1 hypothetical protein [Streptomyces sp. MBT57]